MAQHPSLRAKEKSARHRSVLKRYERIRELKDKEKWDDADSVFGLPKLKILKFKIKKEKAPEAEAEGAQVEGAVKEAHVQEGESKAAKGEAPKKEASQ